MLRSLASIGHASRRSWASSAHVHIGRRFQSTESPLREYFVLVWDRAEANRAQLLKCDLAPPFYTFAGECLSTGESETASVIGNAFACVAQDTKEVVEMMQSSVYNKQNIWDLSTARISPLLTVHSSNTSDTANIDDESVPIKSNNDVDGPSLKKHYG